MVWIGMAVGVLVALVAISYLLEAMRRAPPPPEHLPWDPAVPVRYLDIGGMRLRYVTLGEGPALVLLHTLRTQLDMFQKVIPPLATRFRVYALDYPGHGYSDIPESTYDADFFVAAVAGALDRLDVRDALVVGESIGGSIALLLAARHNPRVARIIAINPYDYDRGRGLRRSSLLANLIFGLAGIPVLGPTVERLRSYPIVTRVFRGGVVRPGALPRALARDMYLVGNRPGHSRAFGSLMAHWPSCEAARGEYASIERPTLLIYGDHDWSREEERAADARAIPGAELRLIQDAGHFTSLDAPDELVRAISGWIPVSGAAGSAAALLSRGSHSLTISDFGIYSVSCRTKPEPGGGACLTSVPTTIPLRPDGPHSLITPLPNGSESVPSVPAPWSARAAA